MSEPTNYRVTLQARGRDMFGGSKWVRMSVDVEATSREVAKRKAEDEHAGYEATWAERRRPRRKA